MSSFSSFCVPEVEGCGPLRDSNDRVKHVPVIAQVGVLDLSKSVASETGGPAQPPCLQHIVASRTSANVCCVDAQGTLTLIDAGELRSLYTVPQAHSAPVTSCSFFHKNHQLLVTSSQDGAIKLWDFRTQLHASSWPALESVKVQVAPPGSRKADMWGLAVRGDDQVFAASFKNSVRGYDVRAVCSGPRGNMVVRKEERQLSKYKRGKRLLWELQVHGDVVTALQFHPVHPNILVSGGEDSLICLCDTAALDGTDNNDVSPVACFSQERAVKSLSLLGPGASCICICSAMEDVGLWQVEGLDGYCREAAGQEVSVHRRAEWLSVRSHPAIREGDSSGYVVNVFYDQVMGRLFILAGWLRFEY